MTSATSVWATSRWDRSHQIRIRSGLLSLKHPHQRIRPKGCTERNGFRFIKDSVAAVTCSNEQRIPQPVLARNTLEFGSESCKGRFTSFLDWADALCCPFQLDKEPARQIRTIFPLLPVLVEPDAVAATLRSIQIACLRQIEVDHCFGDVAHRLWRFWDIVEARVRRQHHRHGGPGRERRRAVVDKLEDERKQLRIPLCKQSEKRK